MALATNVELSSPYGEMKIRATGEIIENGRKGYIVERGRLMLVKFANSKEPVEVPVHWLRDDV